MPQMHFYVPDKMAKQLRERARGLGLPVSRYLAGLARRELGQGWPEDFFSSVIGGWRGEPLSRSPHGELEERKAF